MILYCSLTPLCLPVSAAVAESGWHQLHQRGLAACLHGDYKQSERDLLAAQTAAERSGIDRKQLAGIWLDLSITYQAMGKYSEAESLARQTLDEREHSSKESPVNLSIALNNLAALLLAEGKPREAEPLARRSVAIAEADRAFAPAEIVRTFNNLAVIYQAEGHIGEARSLFARALSSFNASTPDRDKAQTFDNLALLYKEEGQYAKAEQFARRAFDLLNTAGVVPPDRKATALKTLAEVIG